MLVLTRKVGEGVKIDENIFVRIVQVKGKQVRIGIEAPKETRIQREELDSTDATPSNKDLKDKTPNMDSVPKASDS
jgi:carbon storage regulator